MYVKLKTEAKTEITADDVVAIELNNDELIEKVNVFQSWCGIEKHYYGDCARIIYHYFQ
jgi:hypothetical protein